MSVGSSRAPLVVVFSRVPNLAAAVREKCQGINLKNVDIPQSDGPLSADDSDTLQKADVLLACPHPLIKHGLVQNLPNLKWLQSTWAGNDAVMNVLDRSKPMPQYEFTKNSGLFGVHIAEYVIGHMVSGERRFVELRENQVKSLWDTEGFNRYRLLSELSLGLLGMGDIGKTVAKFAKTLGMTVRGLVTSLPEARDRNPDVDEYMRFVITNLLEANPLGDSYLRIYCLRKRGRTTDRLGDLLEVSDYVCSILPSTPQTRGLLSGDVLLQCKQKKSVLINVGRGDVIDEDSLLRALDEGWIGHAVLDVFMQEPLPTSSRLWTHPNVTITPHVSAVSFPAGVTEVFAKNYNKYVNSEPLLYRVNWEKGY